NEVWWRGRLDRVGLCDYPVTAGLDEFQAYGEAGMRSGLAVGDARDGAKRAGESGDRQSVTRVPAAIAEDARAVRADVFRERGFGAGHGRMTGNLHTYFHRDARLATRPDEVFWDPHPKAHLQCPPLSTNRPLHAPDEIFCGPCPSYGGAGARRG